MKRIFNLGHPMVAMIAGLGLLVSQWSPWLLAAGVFAGATGKAVAATLTWDGGSSANSLWTSGTNWNTNTAPVSGDTLVFRGSVRVTNTNNFAANTQFNGIILSTSTGAFVLNGNAINLGGDIVDSSTKLETINLDLALLQDTNLTVSSGTLVIGGSLSGDFGVTKLGTETLVLTGTSTYTGTTAISSGTLQVGNGGSAGSLGSGAVVNDATLVFNRNDAYALSNDISGAGSLRQSGTGLVILTGSNTYTGTTNISAGTLQIGNGGSAGSLGTGAVVNNGALFFNRSDTHTVSNIISGSGSLQQIGTGLLVVAGSNSYLGATTVRSGTLQVVGGGSIIYSGSDYLYLGGTGLSINPASGDNGALLVSGGYIKAKQTYLGYSAGANGVATITSGTWSNWGIAVGVFGSGVLNVNGGLISDIYSSNIANAVGSSGTVNMTGGTWDYVSSFAVGLSGTGTLNMSGGLLTGSNGDISVLPGSKGIATITSGTWSNSGDLTLGVNNSTNGTLNINGGSVTNDEAWVGAYGSGIGTVTMTSGTWINAGTLTIGNGGHGILNMSGGTIIDSSGSIAYGATSTGTATITNGTWFNNGSLSVGSGGNGALNINGSIITNTIGYIALSSSSVGMVTITSGTWSNSSDLTVGSSGRGTLNINGGLISNDMGSLASSSSSSGIATITSGTWSNSEGVVVGVSGTGVLNINGGSIISGSNSYIAKNAGSRGTVTITDGIWSNANSLFVGSSGTGVLNINGGSVTDTFGQLGSFSNGAATITGGTWNSSSGMTVGLSGTGSLTLSDSGVVIVNSGTGTVNLAVNAGSSGTLNSGAGTSVGALNAGIVSGSSGKATVNFNHTGAYTFDPRLTGNLSVKTLASGTTILTGSNIYSGTTTISAGVLQIGAGGSAGTLGSGAVVDNSLLVLNRSGTLTVSNAISGTGSVQQVGTGLVIFTGSSSYSGGTIISSGTLQVGGTSGTLGAGLVADNASLVFNRSNAVTVSNVISGSGSLGQAGGGKLTLTGGNSFSGGVSLYSGTLSIASDSNIGGSSAAINFNGGVLQVTGTTITSLDGRAINSDTFSGGLDVNSASNSLTVGQNLSGTGALAKHGAGTLILTGSNSYSGVTTVSSGTLQVGDGNSSGSLGTGAVANNATLAFNRSDAVTVSNAISGFGSLLQNGTGAIILAASSSYFGLTIINSGTVQVGTGGTTGRLGLSSVLDNGTLVFNRSDTITVSNVITGLGGLTQAGAGTLILSATTNNYAGTTNINAGTLQIGNGGTLGSFGAGVVTDNATLAFNRSNSITVGNVISGSGTMAQIGSGLLALTATNTYSGGTVITSGTLQLGNGGSSGSFGSGDVVNNAALIFNRSDSITVSNVISGTGSVRQNGSGTTLLTGSNYSGATTINAGTLAVNGSNSSSSSTVNSGGTLNGSGATGNVTVNNGGTLGGTLSSKTVTINSGGTLSPGNSPGANSATSLSINSGGTFKAEIAVSGSGSFAGAHPAAGTEYDQTTLTGVTDGLAETVLTLDSTAGTGSILWLSVTGTLPAGGVASATNHPYDPSGTNSLLDHYFILKLSDDADTISGRFAQVTLDGVTFADIDYSATSRFQGANGVGTFVLDGQEWAISYQGDEATNSTTGGNDGVVSAVPEPSTWVMLALGAGAIFVLRRRKFKIAG